MDGNGRWAVRRGLPRFQGHAAGSKAVRRAVEAAAADERLGVLTLYAFSAENWKRPRTEVQALMALFEEHLNSEAARCREQGVRLEVIGRRDRLRPRLVEAIERVERATAGGTRLHLRIAVDYSARDAVLRAVADGPAAEDFERALARATFADPATPPIDLLIRTGGERRLSDQFAWEAAYAELLFLDKMWPQFSGRDLRAAVDELARRERRFGALPRLGAGDPVAAETVAAAGQLGTDQGTRVALAHRG